MKQQVCRLAYENLDIRNSNKIENNKAKKISIIQHKKIFEISITMKRYEFQTIILECLQQLYSIVRKS